VSLYELRDEEKRKACKEANITLIEVPYWWDYSKDSVSATIRQVRPDLIKVSQAEGKPIPATPPVKFIHKHCKESL
jgi:hypothetical protein